MWGLKGKENKEGLFTFRLDEGNGLIRKDGVAPGTLFARVGLAVLVHIQFAGSYEFVRVKVVVEVQADPAVEPKVISPPSVQV